MSDTDVAALEVSHVDVTLRGHVVLDDVTFTLEQGGFLGLIGPNGAGKSVLLRTIVGLVEPQRGSIKIFGKAYKENLPLVGYVPQYARFDLSFPISVLDVALMGRLGRQRKDVSKVDIEQTHAALQKVEMLERADAPIGKLSGGQLQRVLIARALAGDPKLLLLDEPTASLDTKVGQSFYDLLQELANELTIVLVSHDVGVIAHYVKTVACLNRKLHYHNSKEIDSAVVEEVYGCAVELLGHGHAHRVLGSHEDE